MFDPVSLIVAALTRALLAGAQEAGRAAGKDAYQVLKAAILRKYPLAWMSIAGLEQEPSSLERRQAVELALRDLGVGNDQELCRLSEQLFDAVEQGGRPDPADQPKRCGGISALIQLLNDHVARLTSIRANHRLDDVELLSSNIAGVTKVPAELRSGVGALPSGIRQIIEQVAQSIEGEKYRDTERLTQSLQGRNERERAMRIVAADKSIRVSYEALRLTVSFFSELNAMILSRIENERLIERQGQMMFGNAVMIYELSDFMIGYIEGFALDGFAELESLHRDVLQRISRSRDDQKSLQESALREGIELAVREGTLESVRAREAAFIALASEWERYVEDWRQFRGRLNAVRERIPTLEVIRENARVQLDVLELVSMLRFLRQNTGAVQSAVETLQGFGLAPLTPSRVRRLLGLQD